ncbi:hypothetical protein CRUP_018090 [Coryphaenoides rupestris]|nr:hypothetical protein CRUP_018090 [Coryphaenoides rupestris]
MTENTFPVYKVDAIVSFYRSEVLTAQEAKHFSKSDLTPAPKPESVQRLYMRVLQLLYHSRPECHFMVPLMENIQNPVFHEVTTSIMRVYLRMRQFLPMCYINDFSLNDLLEPKTKKTMLVLSGIMNFIHFRKLRMEMSLEHVGRFRAGMERFQACARGIKEAEKKINILTTIPPEKQAEAQELSAAMAEIEANLAQEYQQVNPLNEIVAKRRLDVAEWTQKVAQGKLDIIALKEELEKLKSQIVESPEELKNQMEKLRESTRLNKNSIKDADVQLVELQNSVQRVKQVEAELPLVQCEQVYQKREEMVERIEEVSREAQQLKAKMQCLKDARSHSTEQAQALYDVVLGSLDELHKLVEKGLLDLSVDMDNL